MKIVTLFFLSLSSFLMAADLETRSFQVNDNATLRLDFHKGELKIKPVAGSSIEVNYRIRYEGDDLEPELLAKVKEAVDVQIKASASTVDVEVDYDKVNDLMDGLKRWNRSMPFVDFDIYVPEQANLDIESHKGTMDIQAPAGEIEIESHKGTANVRNVRGKLEIESHKGTFQVEVTRLGDIEIETHKGNITVDIYDATDFTIEGESHRGNLTVTGRQAKKMTEDRHTQLSYAEGSERHQISVETHKGDVSLNFKN